MIMAVNGNGKERIENFGRNWTSRKKLEKRNCNENERNCDEKEVGRIFKKKSFVRPRNEFAVKNMLMYRLVAKDRP